MTLGSFDRAAAYYDATRGLPPDVGREVTDRLAAELAGRGGCLEIGVGTGRIALPLHDRGVPLFGTDVATAMLGRLVDNAGGRPPFPLAVADATALPFAEGSFGAVLASHVLHLVPDWARAVDEAMRVLRPDGCLLVDFGGGTPAPWTTATAEIFRRHGIVRVRPGVSAPGPVAERLGPRAQVRPLRPVHMPVERTLARDLADWEAQIHSWTWPHPPERMHAACAEIRRWAADTGVVPEEVVRVDRVIQWWAFDRR